MKGMKGEAHNKLSRECWKQIADKKSIHILNFGKDVRDKTSKYKCSVSGCGYEWSTAFCNISGKKNTGCPKCAGKAPLTPEEEFALLRHRGIKIEILGRTNSDPNTVFKCLDGMCGHSWKDSVVKYKHHLAKACPKCQNINLRSDEDLSKILFTRDIELIHRAVKSSLNTSVFKCLKPDCGYIWNTALVRVLTKNNPTGCPNCTKAGFKTTKPAWIYRLLIDGPEGIVYSFGVTNVLEGRLKSHRNSLRKRGIFIMEEYEPIFFESGSEALKLESEWKKSEYATGFDVRGFKTECLKVNSVTTNMLFNIKQNTQ